ncbi:adenine deaminase [Thermosulfurimonas dismutans]|uniref:Adenine deaminase n=1 Tax=Thermosulfurimonas dismutans TaxID=999894 RepID=A0A179D500_9BACT|nr:adenine deaminase [Thermosulfurimonas dismutans]OAQ21174.1 Adenine deaminase [Thermosulfurimonas dismutans]
MKFRANLVNPEERTIIPSEIEVEGPVIKAIRRINEPCQTYILPGFVDAHVHIESSLMVPSQFARLAVRHGTVAVVSDPHEIANVLGLEGVRFMLEDARRVPFKFCFGAPSCVPATPFETSGARLGPAEVEELLKLPEIGFLSEVMNFPGVLAGDEELLAKIALAQKYGKPVDGHAPGLRGEALTHYIEAGISTDHEASSYEEAREKIEKGMKILIREGSAARNFETLSPLISEYPESLMFCTDDSHPDDLLRGHINSLVARAVKEGHDLFEVLKVACLNPVRHYGLKVGTLKEGEPADFIEVRDLTDFEVVRTVINGQVVFEKGEVRMAPPPCPIPNRFEARPKNLQDFEFVSDFREIRVIEALDGELFTRETSFRTRSRIFEADPEHDILKIAIINRYQEAPPAVAFVKGFGLKKGAIASSVAHDSHNLVAVGVSDELIAKAVNLVIENRGGLAAVSEEAEMVLPLPVAGLMSPEEAFEVARKYEEIDRFSKEVLGSRLTAPFMTLSFMALPVIPELKLTDRGLFDVRTFRFVEVLR